MSHPPPKKKSKITTAVSVVNEEFKQCESSEFYKSGCMPKLHVYVGFTFEGDNDLKRRICLNHEKFGPVWQLLVKEFDATIKPNITEIVMIWAQEAGLIKQVYPNESEKPKIKEYDKEVKHKTKKRLYKLYFKNVVGKFNSEDIFYVLYGEDDMEEALDDNNSFEWFKVLMKKYIDKLVDDEKLVLKSNFIGYKQEVCDLHNYLFDVPRLLLTLFGFKEDECKVLTAEQLIGRVCEDCEDKVV